MRFENDADRLILLLDADLTANRAKEIVDEAKRRVAEHEEYNQLVMDLTRVQYIDSTGISFIIGLYKSTCSTGKTFKLTGLNQDLLGLFRLMKLDKIFDMSAAG
ncbi:STAS domain-containing protein [Heliobacterium gestii]|uniref:STAS domain-containing protein n=1 Tax=Heliomicrobium gestii TaxID=2699 RepID=A0A845L7D3_HELGE|nr:STAS domain-containing protein [Heliomicrobium gestii]MBM7866066.1 anti-sigma B factor antagonist [Heliomicrobium gestii]MZP42607.1 STAS domain-containing protein [Heliomicrobium gestii]